MALRLTTTSLATAASSCPPSSAGPHAVNALVDPLIASAKAALNGGRFGGYHECFDQANTIEDPSKRYYARKQLIEHGFDAAGRTPARQAAEILLEVATAAVAVLEADPAEPVLLNYAGVALYELWSLDAAQSLFVAANRLDPTVPHLRRNIAECKRRKRGPGRPNRPLHGAPAQLARRARTVAQRAHPATGLTLSLCMIVRDEEAMLPRCLAAVAPAVDEIVIVDTGSQDRTIEIARSFGARVIEREWTGSFSEARNVSFEQATGDWLLYLDADEVLIAEDVDRLRALTGQTWREAFHLLETNFTGEEDWGTAMTHSALRVFRNRPNYRFSGRLHEQIAEQLPVYLPERIHHANVRIDHYGYLGVVRNAKEKERRNIELLLAQKADSPPTAFLHFNLGSEYYAINDFGSALREFEQSWMMVKSLPEGRLSDYTSTLFARMVKTLRACGRHQDAIDRAAEGLELFPGYTDLVLEQGYASFKMNRIDDAIGYWEKCIEMGDAPAVYAATVGSGTYMPRLSLADLHVSRGEVARALELLRWCADNHPEFFGFILPYASALLRTGSSSEDVIAEIERCVPRITPTVRFRLGTALFENGHATAAEAQYRLLLERQPHSGQARIALSEALLYQRRYADGAAEAARLDADSPLLVVAARSELFGWIAAGEFGNASDALGRAAQAGMQDAELALFGSWLGLRTGASAPQSVPLAAWKLLETILEALLRVQDFENFATVLPQVTRSGLPVREQRELLGRIYLRRGFLRSAAQEWMAVVNEAPDARALLGLARVSLANGQPDPAQTFASRALVLDPSCIAATQIIRSTRSMQATL
ncbi:MAG: glycosyltransferase [Solirubrobacteraceae bacterium]